MEKEKCVYCREYGNLPCEKCDKKDLSKVFIDLSKCSEEQRKHIISLLPEPRTKYVLEIDDDCYILCYKYNAPYGYEWIVCVDSFKDGRAELTYPEFIKLFEGGEGENNGWIKVTESLPNALQTVFISNGKGYTAIGCLVESEGGWHWAESNGVIYEENGEIVSECESDDIEVNFWHPLPEPPKF